MQRGLIWVLWLAWLAYWIAAARGAKDTRRRESYASRATHLIPFALAAALLAFPRLSGTGLGGRFLPATSAAYWAGAIMLAAGLGFAVWARQHLAGNWSATVTLKQDHELVRSGPYGLVRHPIYAGLLVAALGTAVAIGEWRALVAFALIAAGVLRKVSIEEHWLREAFQDEYANYCARVPALIPCVRRVRATG
jgi:protein-S-isoprenylcysteine O-methyltransferase Ste14